MDIGAPSVRAIAPIGKQWINGSTLRVRFIGGTEQQRDHVIRVTQQWEYFANLRFDFQGAPDADIRIAFDENDGSWSYIGTDWIVPSLNRNFTQTSSHQRKEESGNE